MLAAGMSLKSLCIEQCFFLNKFKNQMTGGDEVKKWGPYSRVNPQV